MQIEYADGSGRKVTPVNGIFPLDALHLFRAFQSRAQYKEATGKDAPDFDPRLPVKNWFDPDAAGKRGTRTYLVYSWAQDKLPELEEYTVAATYAASVNMLPDRLDVGDNKDGVAEPVPVRDLKASEIFVSLPGGIAVQDTSLLGGAGGAVGGDGFVRADRDVLMRIADKLGV